MNISFIGYGNMAKAIAQRLAAESTYRVSVASPSLSIGMDEQIRTHNDNKEVIKEADVIILAVKPSQMSSVLEEITPLLPPECLLISVAAGLSLSWFGERCKNQAIIRTMPNTPAAVGQAATPMIANKFTRIEQKQCAEHIFSRIGITTWVEYEGDIDSFTALSGSGPAYVFLFIEAMIDSAVALGIEESTAKIFTFQTISGALKLAENNDLNVAELRKKVTSAGGTTAAAMDVLHERFNELIYAAMEAGKQRSQELGSTE